MTCLLCALLLKGGSQTRGTATLVRRYLLGVRTVLSLLLVTLLLEVGTPSVEHGTPCGNATLLRLVARGKMER